MTEQRPGAVNAAAGSSSSQVIKPRINVMFGNNDLSSRSAPTLVAPEVSSKLQLGEAQLAAADSPSSQPKAALTQSTRQQSRDSQDGTAKSDLAASPADGDQMPVDRPGNIEKSRRSLGAGKSADSDASAATVLPLITIDGTATASAALTTVESHSPLNKAPSTKADVRTGLPPASGADRNTRPDATQSGTSEQATQLPGDTAASSALPAGPARAHLHSGPNPTLVSALPSDREAPDAGTNLFTRDTPSLPPVRSQLDQASFHLSSTSAPATAGSAENQLLPLQPDPATSTRGADGVSARTSSDQAMAPASSSPTPTAQILPAVIAFAGRTNGSSQMTVSLHPRDLGEVEIHLVRQTDGSTTVTVVAGEAQTLQELSQNAHHLHAALDAANLPTENRTLNFVAALDPQAAQRGDTPLKSDDTAAFQNQNSSTSGNPGQTPHQRHNNRGGMMASDENSAQGESSLLTDRHRWQMSGLNITA